MVVEHVSDEIQNATVSGRTKSMYKQKAEDGCGGDEKEMKEDDEDKV